MKTQLLRLAAMATLTAAAVACSQSAAQTPVSPSAASGGSTAATADGATLKSTAPALISPVDGITTGSAKVTVVWANAVSKYGEVGLAYELEVAEEATGKLVYNVIVGETPNVGQHELGITLDADTVYTWRIRARLSSSAGPWSGNGAFRTPRPSTGGTTPTTPTTPTTGTGQRTPDPPAGQRLPKRNDLGTVIAVSNSDPSMLRQSCQDEGGNWRLMDAVVDTLRGIDMRYGYNCKRGNCNDTSKDVVSYHWGAGPDEGSTQVYCTDIVSGHCGPTPSIFWNDVTNITYNSGTVCKVTYQRPGRSNYAYGPS